MSTPVRKGPFPDAGKDARPPTRKISSSSLEDFSTRRLEVDPLRSAADADGSSVSGPSLGRRLKRSETWAAPKDPKLMVPKLPLPGAARSTATRPQTCQPEKDTAKLLEEVQAMQAALKQEEDQVHQLRQALSEKDTNASSSDNKDVPTPTKVKKKGGILPSWMRNIIDKANQLMRPAATEFFPDKPYSQQRFTTYETMDSPGAGGQVRRTSFVRRNSFRQSTVSSSRLTKSRTIGNLEPLDHSVSQASLSSGLQPDGTKERRHSSVRRNSSVPAHMARMHGTESIAVEDLRSMAPREMSPKDMKDSTRRSRRRRNSEVRPSS